MARIGPEFDRPAPTLVDSFRDIPTAVIADVAPAETVMDTAITSVSTATSTVGTAVTVSAPPADNLTVHKAVTMASSGDVLVIDAGAYPDAAIWGELLSTSAVAHDLAGTVVDGAVRDVEEIGDLGYPVYARATTPRPPRKEAAGSINVPITCGGRSVEPGDIVVGDSEGVAVVDPTAAPAILEAAEEKLERESTLRDRAAAGEYLYDILGLASRFDADDVDSATSDGETSDQNA